MQLRAGLAELLDDEVRLDHRQPPQPGRQLGQVTRRGTGHGLHQPVAMLEAADQMVPLVPDLAPHRLVVKAAVQDLRHLGAGGYQRRQGRANRADGRANLGRFAYEVGGGAAEELVVEQAPPPPAAQPNDIESGIAVDRAPPVEAAHPLEVLHVPGVWLAQVGAVDDDPHVRLAAQLRHPVRLQLGDQAIRVQLRAFGRLPLQHPPDPLLAMPTGGEHRGKRPRSGCRPGFHWQ